MRDAVKARDLQRAHSNENVEGPQRQHDAEDASERREHDALGEQLPRDPAARCAQRRPNGDFTSSNRPASVTNGLPRQHTRCCLVIGPHSVAPRRGSREQYWRDGRYPKREGGRRADSRVPLAARTSGGRRDAGISLDVSLREHDLRSKVHGARLPAHISLPRVRPSLAPAAGELLPAEGTADLGAARPGVHVREPGVGAGLSVGIVPESLKPSYGHRVNFGFGLFATLRPAER